MPVGMEGGKSNSQKDEDDMNNKNEKWKTRLKTKFNAKYRLFKINSKFFKISK